MDRGLKAVVDWILLEGLGPVIANSSRSYTHLVNLLAQRGSVLLDGDTAGSQAYMRWVRSLEESFGVSIEVRTVLGPEGRPAAIGGTICGADRPDRSLTFTVDGDETRCALRYT